MRSDGRASGDLRPVTIQRKFIEEPAGAVLIAFGRTRVLCTASIAEDVPPWLRGKERGWVTAEYAMLPGSGTGGRVSRNSYQKGRAQEISRLIGRSLRAIIDLETLGERQITVDCDVLQADGGTRTASITGAYVALRDAVDSLLASGELSADPLTGQCAAVSLGIVDGSALTDLCYTEDVSADVDLNLVMKDDGTLIELQGTAEGASFSRSRLDEMLSMGEDAVTSLLAKQQESLASG